MNTPFAVELRWRTPAGTLLALWLTGCATAPAPSREDLDALWALHQKQMTPLAAWSISGRIGLQTGEESWHANLRWRQEGDHYHITLNGPLGQGAAQLTGDAQGVTMTLSDGTTASAADPDDLLRERLGWHIPVTGLRYWVRGLPAPGETERPDLDAQGRLRSLHQGEWHLSYARYDDVQGMSLPGKLVLTHPRVTARLVIDRWDIQK